MDCNDDVCEIFPLESAADDYIYLITTLQKLEEVVSRTGKRTGIPDFGDVRTVGYYFTYDDARDAVVNNSCDIHETMYNYALIEKVAPGLYNGAVSESRSFFKYDREKDMYDPIEEPAFLYHAYGIGIG